MTTTVRIEAHCSDDKEVQIDIDYGQTGETFHIQNGQVFEQYVHDEREIRVREIVKDQAPEMDTGWPDGIEQATK